MNFKKVFAVFTTVLLAVGLAGVGATSASADNMVGVVGDLQTWSSDTNQTSYWQTQGTECFKFEAGDSSTYGSVTNGGKTVTLNSSASWAKLIIKGGSLYNNVITNPQAGVAYASPSNGNNQSDVSHWIICLNTTPPVVQDAAATATANNDATCDAPGTE
jgi:hypothetical protein